MDAARTRSFGQWWARPEVAHARFVVGAVGLALIGLGLLGSGAQGVMSSYFDDDPVWFSLLFVSGVLQTGAVAVLLAGRGDRLVLLALVPAISLAAYAIQQSGDWNLMLGDIALSALIVSGWRRPESVPRT